MWSSMATMDRPLRVGWLLVGDDRVASARIQGFAIHHELVERGIRSEVLNSPRGFDTRLHWKVPRRWLEATCRRRDVLIFQKVESSRAARFARLARRLGTQIVFLQADYRKSPFYEFAHRVVVSSAELARQLQPICQAPITVIEDAIDLPGDVIASSSPRSRRLRVLWIGSRLNFPSLERIRPLFARPEFSDFELITVSDHPQARVSWSRESAHSELLAADLAVIPCLDAPASRAKSNNRLTLFMAAGLPVVASPIPAYRAVVDPGENGFLAETVEEWAAALHALRNPALRALLGQAARSTAWERFAPKVIAGHWEALLEEMAVRTLRVPEKTPGVVHQER